MRLDCCQGIACDTPQLTALMAEVTWKALNFFVLIVMDGYTKKLSKSSVSFCCDRKMCSIRCRFVQCVNLKKITFTWNSFVYIVHAVDVYKDKDVDVIYSIPMTYCCILLTHMCFHWLLTCYFDLPLWYYPVDFVARYFMLLHNALRCWDDIHIVPNISLYHCSLSFSSCWTFSCHCWHLSEPRFTDCAVTS